MVALPLGTGHGQLCSHDAAGRLRPGEGQTDRVGFVPFPAELGPGSEMCIRDRLMAPKS